MNNNNTNSNNTRNDGNRGGRRRVGNYNLKTIFELETKAEIMERKKDASRELDTSKRMDPYEIFGENAFEEAKQRDEVELIDIPKRPFSEEESYNLSTEAVNAKENEMFNQYLNHIKENFPNKRLNYFERNLEVWRQLWPVAERSDILVIVVDARFPLFHFPDAIYNWVRNELNKPVLLVLNKVKFKIHERKRVNF